MDLSFIVMVILIIVFIVVLTLFTYYYKNQFLCFTNPDIQCWTDWQCPPLPICTSGQTGPGCWIGVTGTYEKFQGNCNIGTGATGPNQSTCICAFENTGASQVCKNN